MLGYVTVGTASVEKSRHFYRSVLAGLHLEVLHESEHETMFGPCGGTILDAFFNVTCPFDGQPASVGNGTMIAFDAPDTASVDIVHAAALAAGGRCEGAPGPRIAYHPQMYAAYFRDLDGNKLAVVHFSQTPFSA